MKPWGHEYRIYIDTVHDIWKLSLKAGHKTSTHCHPRKDTILLCLSGSGRLRSCDDEQVIYAGDYVHIKKGAFHSTENIGNDSLDLIEVEMPRNKFDLVRSTDHYGRAQTEYEAETFSEQTLQQLLPIKNGESAHLRNKDIHGKYLFSIAKYSDIGNSVNIICHINVDVGPFIQDKIGIYKNAEQVPIAEKEHGSFLTISSTSSI